MGLSERRVKQKIGNDPRNLAWKNDTNTFGAQFLAKAGHTAGTALGLTPSNGLINPIAVARKLDNSGIGVGRARREGESEGGGAGGAGTGLDELLRRLQSGTNSPSGSPAPTERTLSGFAKAGASDNKDTIVVGQDESASATASPVASGSGTSTPTVRRLAHRQRNLAAKRMANSNSMAMSEILGIRSGDNSPLPSPLILGTPITSFEADSPASSSTDDTNQPDIITTAKLSVGDYFKMRMEEKRKGFEAAMKAAAAAAEGGEVPSPVSLGEEEIVVVGGGAPTAGVEAVVSVETAAESSSSEEEEGEAVAVVAPVAPVVVDEDKKQAKKDKKAKRKLAELEEGAGGAEDAEKARKREKKERKRREEEAAATGGGEASSAEERKRKKEKKKARKTE